jgi:hypothetical protein
MKASTKTLIEVFRHKRIYRHLTERGRMQCWFRKRAADQFRAERKLHGADWLRASLIAGAEWTRWRAAANSLPLSHAIWNNGPQGDGIGLSWAINFARHRKPREAERELGRQIRAARAERERAKFRESFYLTT